VPQKDFRKNGAVTQNLETPHSPENQGEEVAPTHFLNGKSYERDCRHDMKQRKGIVTRFRIL